MKLLYFNFDKSRDKEVVKYLLCDSYIHICMCMVYHFCGWYVGIPVWENIIHITGFTINGEWGSDKIFVSEAVMYHLWIYQYLNTSKDRTTHHSHHHMPIAVNTNVEKCHQSKLIYRQMSNIRRTKSQTLNVSCLVLQLSLSNPLNTGI